MQPEGAVGCLGRLMATPRTRHQGSRPAVDDPDGASTPEWTEHEPREPREQRDDLTIVPDAAAPARAEFAQAYDRLLRLARSCAPVGVDGSDLLQGALVKALTRHPGLVGIDDVEHYLARSIVNGARNARRDLRRWLRRTRPSGDDADQIAAPGGADPASDERDDDHVRALLRALPPRQRAVLYLRFVEDRSVDDVAALLDCRPGTVKSQSARALETLRLLLAT